MASSSGTTRNGTAQTGIPSAAGGPQPARASRPAVPGDPDAVVQDRLLPGIPVAHQLLANPERRCLRMVVSRSQLPEKRAVFAACSIAARLAEGFPIGSVAHCEVQHERAHLVVPLWVTGQAYDSLVSRMDSSEQVSVSLPSQPTEFVVRLERSDVRRIALVVEGLLPGYPEAATWSSLTQGLNVVAVHAMRFYVHPASGLQDVTKALVHVDAAVAWQPPRGGTLPFRCAVGQQQMMGPDGQPLVLRVSRYWVRPPTSQRRGQPSGPRTQPQRGPDQVPRQGGRQGQQQPSVQRQPQGQHQPGGQQQQQQRGTGQEQAQSPSRGNEQAAPVQPPLTALPFTAPLTRSALRHAQASRKQPGAQRAAASPKRGPSRAAAPGAGPSGSLRRPSPAATPAGGAPSPDAARARPPTTAVSPAAAPRGSALPTPGSVLGKRTRRPRARRSGDRSGGGGGGRVSPPRSPRPSASPPAPRSGARRRLLLTPMPARQVCGHQPQPAPTVLGGADEGFTVDHLLDGLEAPEPTVLPC